MYKVISHVESAGIHTQSPSLISGARPLQGRSLEVKRSGSPPDRWSFSSATGIVVWALGGFSN